MRRCLSIWKNHANREDIIAGLATYLAWDSSVFVDILSHLVCRYSGMRGIIMSTCCDFYELQDAFSEMNLTLFKYLRLSRKTWETDVQPMFERAQTALSMIPNLQPEHIELRENEGTKFDICKISLIQGRNILDRRYHDVCKTFKPQLLDAELMHYPDTLPQPGAGTYDIPYKFKVDEGAYSSIYRTLLLHLTTPTIRSAISFLSISTRPARHQNLSVIGNYCMKLKISRDGFVYQMGRKMNMIIMTNCSITGMTNSTDNTDIVALAHCEENSYWLHLLAQKVDRELFLLRVFGIPDPKSGQLINIIAWNTEDTGSLEKSLGRGSANSHGKWIWSKYGKNYHIDNWIKYHTPMSLTGKWCRIQWLKFRNQYLDRNIFSLSSYLAQFQTFDIKDRLKPHGLWNSNVQTSFEELWKEINKKYSKFGYTLSDFLRAEDILAFGLCGLHGELGLGKLVLAGSDHLLVHRLKN